MDRSIAPIITDNFTLNPVEVIQEQINNCNLYYIPGGDLPLLKIELVFKAGSKYQQYPLIAAFANSLLNEGTSTMTSVQIAEKLDALGAYLQLDNGKDFANIIVFCLEKNLQPVLDILYELLTDSIFPQSEFDQLTQSKKATYEVNADKVGFQASQTFTNNFFKGHNYGTVSSLESFDQIKLEDIKDFANKTIIGKTFDCFISGALNGSIKQNVQNFVARFNELVSVEENQDYVLGSSFNKQITLKGKMQSGIRLGINSVPKSHKDIHKISILNTILGGFFGSRLNQNIREEKGWTYGISSAILFNQESATWISAAEVNGEKGLATIEEVKKEIKKLQTDAVSSTEIETVKNFLSGKLLKSFDGSFEQTDRFFAVNSFGLNWKFYHDYLKELNQITSSDLLEMANKHFDLGKISTVVVGPEVS